MLTIDLHQLNIEAHHRILDLGCGEGRHAISVYLLSKAKHVVAVDLSLKDVSIAKEKLQSFDKQVPAQQCDMLVADGLQLPFADECFDSIICSEVLEHIPLYQDMLIEIKRTLKPGGTLAISVPRAWPEQICWWLSTAYHQVEGGHIRIFRSQQLQTCIQNMSFQFQKKHWAHALHTPYWWLRCLFWREQKQVFLARWYHTLLVWDLMKKPWLTQSLEKCLNPFLGKSLVMYFTKQTHH